MARPSLHIDGYISLTFTPQVASIYLCYLFKVSDPRMVQAIDVEGSPRTFFVTNAMPHCTPHHIGHNRYAWLLDHAMRPGGTVVPQQLWSPQGQGDWRRYVEQAQLHLPVFFVNVDGSLGVPIAYAAVGQMSLRNAHEPPPLGDRTTTKIRISVSFSYLDARLYSLTAAVITVARLCDIRTAGTAQGPDSRKAPSHPRKICQTCG
jgi:hypothetical protein